MSDHVDNKWVGIDAHFSCFVAEGRVDSPELWSVDIFILSVWIDAFFGLMDMVGIFMDGNLFN